MPKTTRKDIPEMGRRSDPGGNQRRRLGRQKARPGQRRVPSNRRGALAAGKPDVLDKLQQPTWHDWKEIAKRVFKALGDDRLLAVAAGIVFYGLLAFFPAITALVSIYGLVADPATIREHVSLVSGICPPAASTSCASTWSASWPRAAAS